MVHAHQLLREYHNLVIDFVQPGRSGKSEGSATVKLRIAALAKGGDPFAMVQTVSAAIPVYAFRVVVLE